MSQGKLQSWASVLDAAGTKSLMVRKIREFFTLGLLGIFGLISVSITLAIVLVLFTETVKFFGMPDVDLVEFVTGNEWNPLLGGDKQFGIWPLITGTLMVTAIAALIALPLGLITAIYLSEYAPTKVRNVLKPMLEVLAGIPTVVYGFFAINLITPFVLHAPTRFITGLFGEPVEVFSFFNSTSAGIAVGIMIIPTVSSLSEDALRAVPNSLREASFGVGSTLYDCSIRVVTPAALSGIIASFLLAIARAVGETMIVALAAGGLAQMAFGPAPPEPTYTLDVPQIGAVDINPTRNPDLVEAVGGSRDFEVLASIAEPRSGFYSIELAMPDQPDTSIASLDVGTRRFYDINRDAASDQVETVDATQSSEDAESSRESEPTQLMIQIEEADGEPVTVSARIIHDPDDSFVGNFRFAPHEGSQTMTAYMVQIFLGDAGFGTVEYYSSYAVGATLFIMTLILTLIGNWVLYKYREHYE